MPFFVADMPRTALWARRWLSQALAANKDRTIQHPAPEVSNVCMSQDTDSAPLELEVVIGSGKDLYSHSHTFGFVDSSPQPDHSHEVMRAVCLDPPVRRTCAGSC